MCKNRAKPDAACTAINIIYYNPVARVKTSVAARGGMKRDYGRMYTNRVCRWILYYWMPARAYIHIYISEYVYTSCVYAHKTEYRFIVLLTFGRNILFSFRSSSVFYGDLSLICIQRCPC